MPGSQLPNVALRCLERPSATWQHSPSVGSWYQVLSPRRENPLSPRPVDLAAECLLRGPGEVTSASSPQTMGQVGKPPVDRPNVVSVFHFFDATGNGVIERDELKQGLLKLDEQTFKDPAKVRRLLRAMDTNRDNLIQFEELRAWLESPDEEWREVVRGLASRCASQTPRRNSRSSSVAIASLIHINRRDPVSKDYELAQAIGKGSYGSVQKGVRSLTGEVRAVKTVPKKGSQRKELMREIEVMQSLDHPRLLKLYEVYEDRTNFHFILELCEGGELFDRIIKETCFTETQAAKVMRQIIGGVHYMHINGVCHRDIKPENFLLHDNSPMEDVKLKIIDFGVSAKFELGKPLTEKVGTPFYIAPQVLHGSYDQQCDLWSIGVVMYLMLSGTIPFAGANIEAVLAAVTAGQYSFPEEIWGRVTDDAKDLVQKLLEYDPEKRLSTSQTASHIWIVERAPKSDQTSLNRDTLSRMKAFCNEGQLTKLAKGLIARQMSEEQVLQLKEMFGALDKNGDGQVTFQELKEGIKTLDIPGLTEDLGEAMQGIDVDGNGSIEYTEFLAAAMDQRCYQTESACWAAFSVFDLDGSGTITKQELSRLLKDGAVAQATTQEQIASLMAECDRDGDGQISFDEFWEMMKGQQPTELKSAWSKRLAA